MVTERQRKLIQFMVKLGLWSIYENMRLPCIKATKGTWWLLNAILKRQVVDNLKHAPCCPANHYHKSRLIFRGCTCGANVEMR